MQLLIMQNPQIAPLLELMNGAAYKRIRRKAMLKNGKMRKGMTHKKIVKLAHKEAKRGGKR